MLNKWKKLLLLILLRRKVLKNCLGSKGLRNMDPRWAGFFSAQWDLPQPSNRLVCNTVNCGVGCGCGTPPCKCISTSDGLLLWFSRAILQQTKPNHVATSYNGFLKLRMKFSPFQGLEKARVIGPFATSLTCLRGSQLTCANPFARKILSLNSHPPLTPPFPLTAFKLCLDTFSSK